MNRLNIYLTSFALTIVVVGCTTRAAENTAGSAVTNPRLPVDATVARVRPVVREETVAGSVLANREITIVSEVPRKVTSIHFREGTYVRQGQLLYKLRDSEIMAQLKQVQAEVALARLSESRLLQLLKSESVRQEEYDVALTRLQSLQASEELLQAELEKTSIRAPFSGIVGITRVEVGSLVSPGQAMVGLQEQAIVKVQFAVPEKYLRYIQTGKKITFSPGGQADRIPATITATESGIDSQTRTITVLATTPNRDGQLKPGMSARIYFSTVHADTKGISLPTESLIPGAQGYSVFVISNNVARIQPVAIGDRNEVDALITSGLHDGDTVMISNILRAVDGTPVEIVTIK